MPSHAPHCFSLLPLFSFSLSVEIVGGGAAACSQQPGQANASASAAFGTGRATATGPRVQHGSTRGYPKVNPYPDPSIPYPTNPRASNPYGSPAGAPLPAVPQTRRVNPRYAAKKKRPLPYIYGLTSYTGEGDRLSMHAPPQLQRGRRNGISAREEERMDTGGKPRLPTVFFPRAKLHRFLAIASFGKEVVKDGPHPESASYAQYVLVSFLGDGGACVGYVGWAVRLGVMSRKVMRWCGSDSRREPMERVDASSAGAYTSRRRGTWAWNATNAPKGIAEVWCGRDDVGRVERGDYAYGGELGCCWRVYRESVYAHPSQSCSIDLLTHASFQCMLPELFAVLLYPPSRRPAGVANCAPVHHPHPDLPIHTDADKILKQMRNAALVIVVL
ncbi:hypothetical protein C8J57DRAFT_1483677 [Mycena rebaudengoi]|nr:hypothetical protein C8J57DRAFT_1483677 [Mycena rebaudengoi]